MKRPPPSARELGLALAGGLLLWLCSPGAPRPLGGCSAFFALVPLALLGWSGEGRRSGRPYLAGWLMGLVYHGLADSWLWHNFAWIFPFKVAGSAGVFLLALYLFRRISRTLPLGPAMGLAWAALEWVRAHLPEVPFPHHQLAHALFEQRWFVGSAGWTTEVGLNLILGFSAGTLAALWLSWREAAPSWRGAWLQAGVLIAVLAGNSLLARDALESIEARPGPTVALIQGYADRDGCPPEPDADFRTHLRLSREQAEAGPVDLLAWSETVFPLPLVRGGRSGGSFAVVQGHRLEADALVRGESALVAQALRSASLGPGGGFVAGALLYDLGAGHDEPLQPVSVGALWDAGGKPAGHVAKRNLVPGGEFLPFLRRLPLGLGEACVGLFARLGGGALAAGTGARTLELPATGRFGVAVCYDNAFSGHFLEATREGAAWHLVLSYEAWYRDGAELDQMLAMTVLRALECRRSVVRCTYSGISALVGPDGRIGPVLVREGRNREVQGSLRVQVPLAEGATFAVAAGGWLGRAVVLAALGLAFLFPLLYSGRTRG